MISHYFLSSFTKRSEKMMENWGFLKFYSRLMVQVLTRLYIFINSVVNICS